MKKKQSDKDSLKRSSSSRKTTQEPQTMEELLSTVGLGNFSLRKGETVEGRVVSLSPKEILVDIGRKSFGIVAEWELEQVKDFAKTLKVGEKVFAQVINPENELGYTVLSLRKASLERKWQDLNRAKEEGQDLEVQVLEEAKGGLLVEWEGLRGFIPFTQLEGSLAANPSFLLNKRVKVKVLEAEKNFNRLVLSQKAAVLGVTPAKQREKLAKIKEGEVLKGVVSGIAPFGVFVDIEGLEGLVHISEMSWTKVDNPASLVKVGEKIEAMVIDINKKEGKLNLSLKRLMPDPWKNILDRYPLEAIVKGEVVRKAPYGFFIQLEPGIEGLLHISKIASGAEPKIGQKIECLIERIDPVKRKISLSLISKEKPVGYR